MKSAGPQSSGASATRAMGTAMATATRSKTARKGSDKSVTFQLENTDSSSTATAATFATEDADKLGKSKNGGRSILRQGFFMRALGISSR